MRLVLLGLAGLAAVHRRHAEIDDGLLSTRCPCFERRWTRGRRASSTSIGRRTSVRTRSRGKLEGLFETHDAGGRVRRPSDRDLGAALRALEEALRDTISENDGPRSFLATAARLAGRLGAASAAPSRPLILEP